MRDAAYCCKQKTKGKLGFIPAEAMQKEPVICQRCYRIKHYNESSSITLQQDDFLKLLGHVGQTKALVVKIVDIFDFEGSMISGLARFVGTNPVLLGRKQDRFAAKSDECKQDH